MRGKRGGDLKNLKPEPATILFIGGRAGAAIQLSGLSSQPGKGGGGLKNFPKKTVQERAVWSYSMYRKKKEAKLSAKNSHEPALVRIGDGYPDGSFWGK